MDTKYKKIAAIVVPILILLLSVFLFGNLASKAETYPKTIASLDDKKTTVMELTAAAAATSAAITLIPGDTATPIADKLADISSYFLVVICAIYLEKYLLTITGCAAFYVLVPAACAIFLANLYFKKEALRQLVFKLAIFALAIVTVVPLSVKLSDMIDATYQASIQQTIDTAKQTTEQIESEDTTEEKTGLSGLISSVTDSVSKITDEVKNSINNFVEALAVMIVTSCIIPILVIMFFVWLIKMVLGVNVNLPRINMSKLH